jgi:mannose-6-phosphate isomerase-like protein (cupin superfamily)
MLGFALSFLLRKNRMQRQKMVLSVVLGLCTGIALVVSSRAQTQAQSATSQTEIQTAPEVLNLSELAERGKALLDKARQGSGSAGVTLSRYPGHYTMLTARTASGGAEVHQRYADFLFVVDGEGTELTGGTVIDPKTNPGGEIRGTRLEGATPHILHKGDVIHIPAGTPHQSIQAPGQTITIFVIKVEEPSAATTPPQSGGK